MMTTTQSIEIRGRCIGKTIFMFLLIGFGIPAMSQSGRRANRPSPEPTPQVAVEEAKPTKTPVKSDGGIQVLIAAHTENRIVSVSTAQAILFAFSERLKEEKRLAVKEGTASSSSDAKKIAEDGKDGYVIWLTLSPDVPDSSSRYGGAINYDDVVLQYFVYIPLTGKTKTQGRMYYQAPRRRTSGNLPGMGSDPTRPNRFPVEYTPERAGREAASRLLDSMKDIVPRY
jgi:hypothetical protein